ncbi:Sortilin-related receptor [Thelohanellus kitauei]|uniref:Sortilin-related receptor n=1 Tax=Thelohanellus kitauei TaxID=669202 RepID=A0A0C2IF98_THEKT|nr:Sortilin-related receptor [Thelohanellus kitauei]
MRLSRLKVQDRFENEFKACHNLELFQHIPGMIYSRIYMHKFSYKSKISKNSGRTWEDIDYNPRKCPKECINEGLGSFYIECVLVISDHCKFPTKSRFLTHETAPNLLLAYGFLKIGKDRVEGLFISEDFGSSWYTGKRLLKHFTMLDQGGIIVGIENDGTICYSLDNGLEWIKTNIGEDLANIDIFSFEQNSLKQVLIVAQSKKNNSWILIVLDLSNIFDRECNIDDYLIIPHQTGSRRCFNGLTKTAFKRKVKSACFNTMDHLLHRPNESRCMCTEDDLKCNFGFSMVDGGCEPDPDYFKIQTKCKYGDYVPKSDTVFTFMNQSGIFYKSLNIAGYGKLIDLYSTISQVISYDINTHKRDLFIATHDGIYRINYGHPNFWNGQNMSKILNVEGIRQIAWDPAGYTLYFSVDKELRSFNPDDLAIRTLKTTYVIETFSILPDIGLLVYSEKVMGQLEGLYIVNIREIGGNHVHNFTTDQLFHTAHFFSSSKELMIHFQKSTHLFENIFNPEARSSSKIIENNMAGSDIVRSYKWNGQDLVLTKNQVLYKNMVVVESSTIVDGRLHISYKLLNKICLSAQCSHFCSVHNQTYRCSCPDNMKLHNEFDCVNDLAASCYSVIHLGDSDDMFKCESGECIPISKKCNGFADCVDWSDEVGCQKSKCKHYEECPSNQFLCDDGTACIDISFVCNGKKECPDSSDEKYCQYTLKCKSNEFKCHNLKCISTFKVCDGTDDCGDASDEQYCKISKCKFDQLSCDNQTCVGLSQFCDGHFDCLDNSDEANCKKYDLADKGCDFKCDNKCLDGSKLCDGYVDCEDESDEVNCIINYECPHATMLKCRTGHQCYKKEHKCDGFRDCLDGSDEYKCPFVGKCDLDYHFNCNDGTCVEINDYCNGIKDCRNGNDEPVSCATSPLIINFFHNFSRGSSLQLEWNGNRLDSNEFYHISLIDLDTNQAIIDDYRYENRQLTVPHIEICHRYIAAVTLAGTMTGRVIQFTARNEEIKPPKHLNFFYRSNKLSWKYPGKLCIPVTYFVFCYRKNILVFRRFMFENSAILTSEVDSCQIATCPKSVFNISCSKYATIQFEYNRSYKYLVALGVNLPFILFFIFLLVFVWLYFKNALVSIKNNISKFILFTTNRYRRRFKRRRKFDLALSQLDQV